MWGHSFARGRLNTGGDQATGTCFETAQQTVFHDHGRRSSILLSAIPA